MNNKLVLPVSSLASAAVAFGLGAMIFTGGNAPASAANPDPTPSVTAPVPATQKASDAHGTSTSAPAAPTVQPTRTAAATAPEKPKTKPKATKSAGSEGPIKDAQGDGKILDDLGKSVFPSVNLPVPDEILPFPDKSNKPGLEAEDANELTPDENGKYPYDPNWGDDEEHAADPGVVCDPELAANLGVPVADHC